MQATHLVKILPVNPLALNFFKTPRSPFFTVPSSQSPKAPQGRGWCQWHQGQHRDFLSTRYNTFPQNILTNQTNKPWNPLTQKRRPIRGIGRKIANVYQERGFSGGLKNSANVDLKKWELRGPIGVTKAWKKGSQWGFGRKNHQRKPKKMGPSEALVEKNGHVD